MMERKCCTHPRHHRPDWWQINLVVKIVQHLLGIGQRSLAMHAGQRLCYDRRIGIAGQRPATTLPAQATLASPRMTWQRWARRLPMAA